jgi:hypothetical protein
MARYDMTDHRQSSSLSICIIYLYLFFLYLFFLCLIYLYLSVSICIYVSIYLYKYLIIYLYLYLSISVSIYLYLYLCISAGEWNPLSDVQIIHTPGHTAGSVCILYRYNSHVDSEDPGYKATTRFENVIFTGDHLSFSGITRKLTGTSIICIFYCYLRRINDVLFETRFF